MHRSHHLFPPLRGGALLAVVAILGTPALTPAPTSAVSAAATVPQASTCTFEPPFPPQDIRSRACRRSQGKELQVLVVPVDERREALRGPYCGGKTGDTEYSGRYKLVSLTDGAMSGEILLPGEYLFNAQRPEYGVRYVAPSDEAPPLVALYQYAGCNNQRVELYRFDAVDGLDPVVFVDSAGEEHRAQPVNNGDEVSWSSSGETTLCHYDNSLGGELCSDYRYDGGRLVRIARPARFVLQRGTRRAVAPLVPCLTSSYVRGTRSLVAVHTSTPDLTPGAMA